MRKKAYAPISKYRKAYHLKLKDLAFILNIDIANLSRFEAGNPNPKALLGYHIIFNLSMDSMFGQLLSGQPTTLLHRCFQLMEIIKDQSHTAKNQLRMEGLDTIITRLASLEETYEG